MADNPVFIASEVNHSVPFYNARDFDAEVWGDADAALKAPLFTVTSKTRVPPSGDKRDYMSLGPYWWPNPETSDGLPYVRRDGMVNPESLQTDRQVMEGII